MTGKTLDEWLKPRGSAARLAKHLDCSKGLVTAWRHGKHLPDPSTRRQIEAWLTGPVDWESEALDLAAFLASAEVRIADVARDCGVSVATVYAWKKGLYTPSGRHIPALRKSLAKVRADAAMKAACPFCGAELQGERR